MFVEKISPPEILEELILDEHKENVNYLIEVDEGIISSCSSDGFIKIWNF